MNSVIATGGGVHKLSCLLKNDLYKCALLGSFVLSLRDCEIKSVNK